METVSAASSPPAAPRDAACPPALPTREPEYGGFWIRLCAHLIDSVIFSAILTPILFAVILPEFMELAAQVQQNPKAADPLGIMKIMHSPLGIFVQYGLPAIAVFILWRWRSATPGKMILKLKIVDAETLGPPSTTHLVIRFFGYLVSMLPFCIGFFAIGWDPKKQGWHDKLAKTLVVQGT